ncbi:MAG: hypothetical protein QM662_05085 [Gordonia sp. (in: high G+C Gram-positive bacteria)]
MCLLGADDDTGVVGDVVDGDGEAALREQFPREGGMIEFDADSPPRRIHDFRTAVATMHADGSTNIPNALHEAANLLYRYGRPGNEKLVVLISDGAHGLARISDPPRLHALNSEAAGV